MVTLAPAVFGGRFGVRRYNMSMRMRKKRNFEARMRACEDLLLAQGTNGILNMKEAVENFRAWIDFEKAFGNNNPVALEIGCGKGGFVRALAKQQPKWNFLALEKMSNVILTPLEAVKADGAENIKFLNIRAECLPCYIPENSLDCIYLNFSTPLPKLGHRPHDTRHTCISMLTVAGVSDKVIKKIVGHKGQSVTEVVYTHFEIEELIDAINRI